MILATKKLTITTLLCMTFFALFGFSVYAGSDDINADGYSQEPGDKVEVKAFNYSDTYLLELVEVNEITNFATPTYSSYDLEIYRSGVLKDLGSLELSSGFDRDRLTTFLKTKTLTGVGKEGVFVGLRVFYIDELDETIVTTQDKVVTLGKSGLYNETVYFDHVGVNYVLLTVEDPITFAKTKRLYKVTRKKLETRNKLENMTINFLKEEVSSPNMEELVPENVDFGF